MCAVSGCIQKLDLDLGQEVQGEPALGTSQAYYTARVGEISPKVPLPKQGCRGPRQVGTFLSWGEGLGEMGQSLDGQEKQQRPEKGKGHGEMEGERLRGLLNLSVSQADPPAWGRGSSSLLTCLQPDSPPPPQCGLPTVSIKPAPPFPSSSFPEDRTQGRSTCPVSALTTCLT